MHRPISSLRTIRHSLALKIFSTAFFFLILVSPAFSGGQAESVEKTGQAETTEEPGGGESAEKGEKEDNAEAKSTEYPVTITDTLGNEITLDQKPERIVIAGKATQLTANAFYLFEEAREDVVALGSTNQGLGTFLPHLAEHYESVEKLSHQVGPEQILAQKPDLFIVKDFIYGSLGKQVAKLGVPVLALSLESPEKFKKDIRRIGRAVQAADRAEEIVNEYDSRLDEVTEITDSLDESEKPSALLLYYSTRGGETAFNIAPAKWIQTFQVEAAGGKPVWTDTHAGRGWMTINFEQIAAWDPDHILITSFHTAPQDYIDDILEDPQWKELRAVKNDNVEAVPADFYSWTQPDTRWILGIQWMAEQLHPERFADLYIREEAQEFYTELYELEPKTYKEFVLPRLEEELSE